LHAVAVAPDGSAIAAGERRALLWRPADGGFRMLPPPPNASFNATFTSAAMPSADRAWLTASSGQIFAGQRDGDGWRWTVENLDAAGDPLALDDRLDADRALGLEDIAVDAAGRGYAVGDEGLILKRSPETGTWERIAARYRDNFTSVALSAGPGAPGALIGGKLGVVLTLVDGKFRVARHADPHDPLIAAAGPTSTGSIVGLALLPGTEPGQVEAWAALQVQPNPVNRRSPLPQAMLHFSSDPDDDLLDGVANIRPLPDAPLPRPGEIAFAAFGRSDCHAPAGENCTELHGTTRFNDVVSRRIADEVARRAKKAGGPTFALFTGDISEAAGRNRPQAATPLDQNVVHRRWVDLVARRLARGGVPVWGAVGRGDLAMVSNCGGFAVGVCVGTREAGPARTNALWRETMAAMPQPWGDAEPAEGGGVEFVPVETGSAAEAPGGGANTHYAFDVRRDGKTVLRVAAIDSSQGSLAASEREQQPVEAGGQTAWLDRVLCRRGTTNAAGQECTLDPDVPSVVLGNVPTYSYGPGGVTETMTDSAVFEATLLQHKVTTMVSGRLGWNGRYFATAPGLHFPCPDGEYPTDADTPRPGDAPDCGQAGAADQARAA
ncbi:MAG TPA: hypothetical protein VGW10_12615, partial [Solirubrobacteraceae bacterium]|nr:hypothetical protein [Solirubrobacteraceae bacterium]